MADYRIDKPHETILFEVSWEEDKKYRTNPKIFTQFLREQVPVLDYVKWRVDSIEPGTCESVLPLNAQSTNQHFTHQAALILLAADYTGGIALLSLMPGWPVVGVHPVKSGKSMSLWLLKAEIKYIRPSVGDLTVKAQVDPEKQQRAQRRFLAGKPAIETIPLLFMNGDVKVGEASLTYFAQQSESLRSDGVSRKVHTLYELKLTSSAEMIAGVRARESGGLFEDPFAAGMAGQHGLALATRFCERLPQLGGMVAARTHHLDSQIKEYLDRGGRDIALLGVGWDMRPFRLDFPEGTRIFEIDFPTTLAERQQRIADLDLEDPPGVERFEIPLDLRTMTLSESLDMHLQPDAPLFIAWEGMTMYFEKEDVQSLLKDMGTMLKPKGSRLWVDLVDRKAVETPEECAEELHAFMHGMRLLGEPFIFGIDSVHDFMKDNGYYCHEVACSNSFLDDKTDPIYSVYNFCVASTSVPVATSDDTEDDEQSSQILRVDDKESTDVKTSPHTSVSKTDDILADQEVEEAGQ